MLTTYLTIALVSYLLGSIPFGYILVKLFRKQDIRQTGSGNIGATNVARSGAKGLAIATLLLDAVKGWIPVKLTFTWFLWAIVHGEGEFVRQLAAVAALFAIVGHCYPVWLKFKGGKGVATGLGALAVLAPRAIVVAIAAFVIVLAVSRFVSAGSVISTLVFPIAAYYFYPPLREMTTFLLVIGASAIIILKHRDNIRRLLAGTEHKFGTPKTPPDPVQVEKNA